MVCLRDICINTLHKGDNDDDDNDNNNNNKLVIDFNTWKVVLVICDSVVRKVHVSAWNIKRSEFNLKLFLLFLGCSWYVLSTYTDTEVPAVRLQPLSPDALRKVLIAFMIR